MSENPETINEIDLEHHMNDVATRVGMVSSMQRRYFNLQRIFLKAQLLSDKDFETALTSLETLVDTMAKKKNGEDKSKENIAKIITNSNFT